MSEATSGAFADLTTCPGYRCAHPGYDELPYVCAEVLSRLERLGVRSA